MLQARRVRRPSNSRRRRKHRECPRGTLPLPNSGGSTQGQRVQGQVAHSDKLRGAGVFRRVSGGKRTVALDRLLRFPELGKIRGSIREGIMNWDGLLCASIVSKLPAGLHHNFVQEATVAEHELEQEVRSLVLHTDGSASMSDGWPKKPALASWSVVVLAQCHSRLIPLFACAAPVELDPVGSSLHLGASRKTNNAGEVSAVTGVSGHSLIALSSRVCGTASDCEERQHDDVAAGSIECQGIRQRSPGGECENVKNTVH